MYLYHSILTGTGNRAFRISLCILYGGIYSHIIWPRTSRNMQVQKLEHLIICKLSCSISSLTLVELRDDIVGNIWCHKSYYIYRTYWRETFLGRWITLNILKFCTWMWIYLYLLFIKLVWLFCYICAHVDRIILFFFTFGAKLWFFQFAGSLPYSMDCPDPFSCSSILDNMDTLYRQWVFCLFGVQILVLEFLQFYATMLGRALILSRDVSESRLWAVRSEWCYCWDGHSCCTDAICIC